ncbi:MAG TPA: glycosyltransferase, partial [Candidatus Omnitrophota bacterium]|nr:glycosyltransferase [Candidatus Omnitrophota bacterium]
MRIAFFCDSYKPYLSGVTNSVDLLADGLRALGDRVFIFAPRYPGHVDTDPDVIRFPSLPTGYPNFRLALPYVNRVPDVDLIHSHSPFQAGLLARYLAGKRKLPFVYTFHTLFTRYIHYARFFPEPLSKLSLIGYAQQFCRRCDLIIAPSEMSRRVLRAWKIKNRIEVIPTGVDIAAVEGFSARARKSLREKHGIPADATVLLYVGRLAKEKNISFLLKAFRYLKEKDLYLVLVGGGPLMDEVRRTASDNMIITGEVGYPEVLSYYFIGDIFVFASLTETQGLVLAEAKAAGLPTVASFAGGLVDTVRSGIDGYLTPRNISDFNSHIKRLIDDRALRGKMGKAAGEHARDKFSSAAVALQME